MKNKKEEEEKESKDEILSRKEEELSKFFNQEKLKISNTRKLYIPFYFMILILFGTIAYIKISEKPLNDLALQLAVIFSILLIIATEIHRIGNSYEINNRSVVHKKGYFSTISKTIQFGAISDSDVSQNLWQRIFRYGNVEIHMYSRESKSLIKDIDKPFKFVGFLQNKLKASGGRKRG